MPSYKRLIIIIWVLFSCSMVDVFGQGEDNLSIPKSPNILLIIADDLGYTDIGAFGREIATPIIDRLATQGIKFSNFHTLPSCAPTRSALLSGADNHIAGVGAQDPADVTEYQKQFPGYEGALNHRVAALPEVLKQEWGRNR